MALSDIFKRLTGKSPKPEGVILTSINLKLGADVHAINGRKIEEEVFQLEIPFHNKMGSGLLPAHLKGPEITINEVLVEKPFELVESSPKTPLNVPYMSSIPFTLKIRAPEGSYSGPLSITFGTDSKDNVNIDLKKITLMDGPKTIDMEDTATNMILKKSQIIRRDVQLYKILKHGRVVQEIGINEPFEIVSSEPATPFTVDRKDSYIMKLYIKCPDFNYAGPMEISFK